MKERVTLTIMSLLSIVFFMFHITGDIVRGFEKGGLGNLGIFPICALWLYGALVVAERRSGHIIMLLGAIVGSGVPVIHMMGKGLVHQAKSDGAFVFIFTTLALGVTGLFSLILSVRGLWRMRRSQARTA